MCRPVNDVGCEIDGEMELKNRDLVLVSPVVTWLFLPAAHHVSGRGASECGGKEDEGGT